MKNIVHTLTLAQMRANPRRTLVTLVGVVLSVTMLTAVFAGADSFLNLLYRQAEQIRGHSMTSRSIRKYFSRRYHACSGLMIRFTSALLMSLCREQ